MTKRGLEFRILVIVICLIFDICDLEFLVTSADFRVKERRQMPPLEVAQSRVLRARLFYCLWAVIVVQSFGQVASGYLAKFGYPANRLTMMKSYILLL